jgi:hypothetical protein
MPGPGEFNPPTTPADGEGYTFGGVEWKFDAQFGVWNIAEGTIIGGIGPPGPVGPAGPPGAGGPPGTIVVASTSVTGVARFDSNFFSVSPEGLVAISDDDLTIRAAFAGGPDETSTLDLIGSDQGSLQFSGPVGSGIEVRTSGSGSSTVVLRNLGVTGINGISGNIEFSAGAGMVLNGVGTNSLEYENDWGNVADAATTLAPYVVVRFNGSPGNIVAGQTGCVVYRHSSGQLTGSSSFQYDGSGLTYTSNRIRIANANLSLTVTGPNITLGQQTQITGGIFTNPAEKCASFIVTADDLVINGASGSIQRFTVIPTNKVTIKAGTGWNTATDGATETIAVIVKWGGGYLTGSFDNTIISGNPVLFGVTGGIEMFTLMRVNMGGAGLTMGLPIANGLTGRNYNWT